MIRVGYPRARSGYQLLLPWLPLDARAQVLNVPVVERRLRWTWRDAGEVVRWYPGARPDLHLVGWTTRRRVQILDVVEVQRGVRRLGHLVDRRGALAALALAERLVVTAEAVDAPGDHRQILV